MTTGYIVFHHGLPCLLDPNSSAGLTFEGAMAAKRGVAREENPYLKSHPGSLAEKYWFAGWDEFANEAPSTAVNN